MRQLEQVRSMMRTGKSLAGAAMDAGFADQSHMTRQFRRAYGLSPTVRFQMAHGRSLGRLRSSHCA